MTTTDQDAKIRDRAYALWELDGSPEGNEQHYWHEAERELAEEATIDPAKKTPKVTPIPVSAAILPR